jgi:thiol-disulfide isomerase/thioredoxin
MYKKVSILGDNVKKLILILLLLLLILPIKINALSSDYKDVLKDIVKVSSSKDKINIYLFYGDGCPHCEKEMTFLDEIKVKYGNKVNIYKYETWYNDNNLELMKKIKELMQEDVSGSVPLTVVGEKSYMGYSEYVGEKIENQIIKYLEILKPSESSHPVMLGFVFSVV